MKQFSNHSILLLVSILLITSAFVPPSAVWPNYGQTPFYLDREPINESEEVDKSAIISYEELPPAAQDSFDNPVPNKSRPLYSDRDREAIQILSERQYVEYDNEIYNILLEHSDGAWVYITLLRFGILLTGIVTGIIGAYFRLHQQNNFL